MATVTYDFTPNQDVHVITDCGIQKGLVIQVRINALVTETTVDYDIRLDGEMGTTAFKEKDVFATLSAAVTEYESRLS